MVAVGDHLALAFCGLVEAPGDPYPEALHRTAERDLVRRLHNQVQVMLVDREVDHANAEAVASAAERAANDGIGPPVAKVVHTGQQSHLDPDRMARIDSGAGRMRHS